MRDLFKTYKCLRRLVITYNIFFWVTGPAIVGMGAWLYVVLDQYDPVVRRSDFDGPAFIIIMAGGTSVISGLIGCLGAINEHKILLRLYFILMFVVCCLEIVATVYSFILFDDMKSTINDGLTSAVIRYHKADDEAMDVINYVQEQFSCCGIHEPNDWLSPDATIDNVTGVPVLTSLPLSCCNEAPMRVKCAMDEAFSEGCLTHLVSWTKKISKISGWTIFGMACLQVLALSIICCFTEAVSYIHFW